MKRSLAFLLVLLLGHAGRSEAAPQEPAAAKPALASPAPDDLATRGLTRVKGNGAAMPAPPDWKKTFVSLTVRARTSDGQAVLVGEGARLHTGERLELFVSVARTAYVYLIQVFPNGESELLYPSPDEPERLGSGRPHRVPTSPDDFFQLDEVVGTERVMVIASERPLEMADPALMELVNAVKERRAPSPPPAGVQGKPVEKRPRRPETVSRPAAGATVVAAGPSPPNAAGVRAAALTPSVSSAPPTTIEDGIATAGTRGLRRTSVNAGRSLDLEADRNGIASQTFVFSHVP